MLISNVITSGLVVEMSRNESVAYIMSYVLFGLVAIAAVVPWDRLPYRPYEFEVVKQNLQHPIIAEAGKTIAVLTHSTVRPPRNFATHQAKGRIGLLAFKVSEDALHPRVIDGSGRLYKTDMLDRNFANKLLSKAPKVRWINFQPKIEGTVVSTGDILDVTLFARLLPAGYDSADYQVESLRKKCSGQLVTETSGLTVARQASGCIHKLASIEGFALQSPSGFHTKMICFEGRQGPTHCDMETMYKSRLISIRFDAKRMNDWREVQREVIAWLNDQLVFEMNADLGKD